MTLQENFNKREFECKCGCKMPSEVFKNVELLAEELQAIRDRFNAPIKINSAYRCISHNRAVGGSKSSQHILGKACDITIAGFSPDEVADGIEVMLSDESLFPFHIGGIGRYNSFTHIDIRPNTARWDLR